MGPTTKLCISSTLIQGSDQVVQADKFPLCLPFAVVVPHHCTWKPLGLLQVPFSPFLLLFLSSKKTYFRILREFTEYAETTTLNGMAAFFFHNQSPSTSRVCPPNRGTKIPSSNTHLQFYCRQLHCLTWLAFLFHYFGLALAITVFDLVESPTKKRNSPKSVTEPDCCPEKKTKQFCAGVGIQGALWRKLTMV